MESETVVVVVSITLVLFSAAVGVWVVWVYRSHRMPNRPAQAAMLAVGAELRLMLETQRETGARLLHSISGAGLGAWSIDLSTGILWRSRQYDVIFGYASSPPPQWTLRMFFDHVVLEDREEVERTLLDTYTSANVDSVSVDFECRIRRADGAVRWIAAHGARESKAQAGSMIFGLVQDISEQKQAEAQLKVSRNRLIEKEQRLAEAQQIAKVGSWECDFATDKLSGSDELCRIFGLEPGEFHGTFESFMDYVHPEDRELAKHVIQSACQSLQPFHFEHRIIQPNGQVRLIEAQGRVTTSLAGVPMGMAGIAHDVTERQAAEEHLHRLAHYDSLTGLPNRRLFYESLAKEVEVAKDQDWTVALLYLDLDRFKYVNDTFGHLMGDELLRQVSGRILSCTRVRDTVGRLGGDEFGVVAITSEGPDAAATMAEKIIAGLQQPFVLADHDVIVTPSIGIALCPADSCDTETLIKFADMAMYHAKAAGRNGYRFYTPVMNVRAREKLQLETALREAIDRGEFVLHYQPAVDTDSGEWTSVEALLRWSRPGHGLVLPAHFVPALEDSGLIVPVGRWIIDRACRQLSEWRDAGIGGISVSVNVSAKQVRPSGLRRDVDDQLACESDEICEHVERCLEMHNVAPGSLKLELTETALMSHAESTIELLVKLKKLGVQILADDFGTGYSSLSYLKRFPIDALKIDREFINDLSTDPDDRAITRAIISLAHSLNLKVIAEGVETREQMDFLQDEHCDEVQGYYIAHPMPPKELLKLFQSNGQGLGPEFNERQHSLFSRGDVVSIDH